MEPQYVDLGEQAFLLINSPLVFLNFTANIFYACCLIFPACDRRKHKPPLKTLLGFLVCCSIIYFVPLPSMYRMLPETESSTVFFVLWVIFLYNAHNSMAFSVWLNFYYYIQIVPSQRAFLIWVKKNIRSVIFMALLFDGTFFSITASLNIAGIVYYTTSGLTDINGTWTEHHIDSLFFTGQVFFVVVEIHTLIYLCIMMVSSISTVLFLQRHIRSMAQGGSCLSTVRVQSQMRVTITGISQGVLYVIYGIFYFLDLFTHNFFMQFVLSSRVFFTVTSLYILGTTINLGIGQTVFRQRAADIWKALKTLRGGSMVT